MDIEEIVDITRNETEEVQTFTESSISEQWKIVARIFTYQQ